MTVDALSSNRHALATARPQPVRGAALVRLIRAELPSLSTRWQAPLTARAPWLLASLTARQDQQPWAVALRGPGGHLRGIVVLADEADADGRLRTTLLGTDGVQRGAVLADDEDAAYDLGRLLEGALLARPYLGSVVLGPLPADDPRLHALVASTGIFELTEAEPIPVVRQHDADSEAYLSDGMRRTLRKARNRLRTDGRAIEIDVVTDRAAIRGWLPELARHHQARDHASGRESALDSLTGAALWRTRLGELVGEGLELVRLRLDGQLAAYVLGVPDGRTYRLVDGRFVGPWARYAPGRLLENAVLQRVLDDPLLDELDWMTAVAPETLIARTGSTEMVTLRLKGTR